MVPVSSMSACDTAACLDSGMAVHFGAHPTLTRVVHLWAGVDDGGRNDGHSNKLSPADTIEKANVCAMNADIQVIAAGTSLLEWRDIRRIRAPFPTNAQTLYCLKDNSFPL